MKNNRTIRYLSILVATLISLTSIISIFPPVIVMADAGKWTDEGNYDPAWLGDYDNTASYTIKSSSELAAFLVASHTGKNFDNKTVKMTADIDMSAHVWEAAFSGDNPFLGTFDGRGYVIKGLQCNSANSSAAFVHSNKGTVVNCLFSCTFESAESAGISIYNYGKILNSAVIGNVGTDTASFSGGISVYNNGTIDNSYSLATVKGSVSGGICAKNTGSVNSCVWDNTVNGSGDLSAISECEKLSDKQAIINKLNKKTKANGWMFWTSDINVTFDGFPVLTSKEPIDTNVKVVGVTLSVRQKTMWIGGTFDIKYTVLPANASNKNVRLFSTNEAVATVDSATGKVTAKSRGYAVIRALTEDGNKVADCYITVKTGTKPTGIKLDSTSFRIPAGKPVQLNYSIIPAGASYWGASFSSADTSIVDCSESGVIVGVQPGVTVVTATTGDGGKSISALVTVVEDTYSDVWVGNQSEQFGGGDGTRENPYLIENGAHLALLAFNVNNGTNYKNTYFRQTVGIMLNDTTVEDWSNVLTTINSWNPIGTQQAPFLGHYDGGGFSISGIYIQSSDHAGLFGYTGNESSILNVTIRNSVIRGSDYVGAVCAYNQAEISDCDVINTLITGNEAVGGICGYNSSVLSYCKNYANITADKNVGGIAGKSDSIIVNCTNYGTVAANYHVGGIVGSTLSLIENCLNTVVVYGVDYVGGIVGEANLGIINCYSDKFPSGQSYIGMICGYAYKPVSSYTLESYPACGNRDNEASYILEVLGDGSQVLKNTGEYYIDILNMYYGCISSNSYFRWEENEEGEIKPSYMKYNIVSIHSEEYGITLEGVNLDIETDYAFDIPDTIETEDILSAINHSAVFGSKPLEAGDILYSVRFSSDAMLSGFTHRIIIPFGIDTETQSFSQIALINTNDTQVDIYIPEIVHELADGRVVGMMKCVSHIWELDELTDLGDRGERVTFIYADGMITTSILSGGSWIVADLGDNKYVVPIETGSVTTYVASPPSHIGVITNLNNIIISVLIIAILGTSVIIIIVQRSKNNLRLYGQINTQSDNCELNDDD